MDFANAADVLIWVWLGVYFPVLFPHLTSIFLSLKKAKNHKVLEWYKHKRITVLFQVNYSFMFS